MHTNDYTLVTWPGA